MENTVDHEANRDRLESIRNHISERVSDLLETRYFKMCRTGDFTRAQLFEVLTQLYCFSTFFERILTRRMSRFTSDSPYPLVRLARTHLREEIGHAELFRNCLVNNGMTSDAIARVAPKLYTKAVFGYLLATIEYESELVANIAIMQVMELIGMHFFESTMDVMERHGIRTAVFAAHAEDDRMHSVRGLEFLAAMDDKALEDSKRVIGDLFHLMTAAIDEWVGTA